MKNNKTFKAHLVILHHIIIQSIQTICVGRNSLVLIQNFVQLVYNWVHFSKKNESTTCKSELCFDEVIIIMMSKLKNKIGRVISFTQFLRHFSLSAVNQYKNNFYKISYIGNFSCRLIFAKFTASLKLPKINTAEGKPYYTSSLSLWNSENKTRWKFNTHSKRHFHQNFQRWKILNIRYNFQNVSAGGDWTSVNANVISLYMYNRNTL